MPSTPVRYLCLVRLDRVERVLLWEGEDPGPARVVVDSDGYAVVFASEGAVRAQDSNVSAEAPTRYDLDSLEAWSRSDATIGDCKLLLDAWNLFVDFPDGETLFRAADARSRALYDKLFHACRLPAMAVQNHEDEVAWTTSEVASLERVLQLGLAEVRARLR